MNGGKNRLKRLLIGLMVALASEIFADELAIAREALRDGLWSVARKHAEAACPEAGESALLVILESYASENRWDEVKSELVKAGAVSTNAAFAYYRAACEGRIDEAIQLLREGSDSEGSAVKMLEADLFVRKGDFDSAKNLWREVLALTNISERVRAVASVNLGDSALLRTAYSNTISTVSKRMIALRLGRVLVEDDATFAEGERLIRATVTDSPDADGAREAIIALVAADVRRSRWPEAIKASAEAVEMWPDIARNALLQECRGTSLSKLGKGDEALQALVRAEELSEDDASRARIILKAGEVLSDLGRGAEAMFKYRTVLEKYPSTETAKKLKRIVDLREKEMRGRGLYGEYRFEEAYKAFSEVAEADPSRVDRMAFYRVLCLYGLGRDEEAASKAAELAARCDDLSVRAEATLWIAKLTYNRGEWKASMQHFLDYANMRADSPTAPSAVLWATRAAFAASDFPRAIAVATLLAERYPDAKEVSPALVVQAEALIEQSRFDEAVLVLERVALSSAATDEDKLHATVLKADALFALGADNAIRYENALEAYRMVSLGPGLDAGLRLSIAFKIGRVLEKLKRPDEAIDQYYTEVVLAYRNGRMSGLRFGDEARAAFSRAAFRLADIFEGRGRDRSAIDVLRLVVESSVPAAEEASKRMERIMKKGRFL